MAKKLSSKWSFRFQQKGLRSKIGKDKLRFGIETLEERLTPTAELLTVADPSYWGDTGDRSSTLPYGDVYSMSADGQIIVFQSSAANLVPFDQNQLADVFVYDRGSGLVEMISTNVNGTNGSDRGASEPMISEDGRYVAFISDSANLVNAPIVNNFFQGQLDVYVRDRFRGETFMISSYFDGSRDSEGSCDLNSIITTSDGGLLVAWETGSVNMVAGDTNNATDVFVRKLNSNGTLDPTKRISLSSTQTQGNFASTNAVIAGGGRYVVFTSNADNLVTGDTNTASDIFVRDLQTDTTELVTANLAGTGSAGAGAVYGPRPISDDGRYVVFESGSNALVSQTTTFQTNAFLRDLVTDTTYLLSANAANTAGSNGIAPSITGNGLYATFLSNNSALGTDINDTNGQRDVILANLTNLNAITRKTVSVNSAGNNAGNTASGQGYYQYDFSPGYPQVTEDGRYVVFVSEATNLVTGMTDANNTNVSGVQRRDVFRRDMQLGQTILISQSADGAKTGNLGSHTPVMSSDGKFVLFEGDATDLAAGRVDNNKSFDVFLRDVTTGFTDLVSRRSPFLPSRVSSNAGVNFTEDISADGRYLLFASGSSNLQTDVTLASFADHLFLRDRQTGKLEVISVAPNGTSSPGVLSGGRMSSDARFVVFRSSNSGLDYTGAYASGGVYIRDRVTGLTRMVSRNTTTNLSANVGTPGNEVVMSENGRFIAFTSDATNLDSSVSIVAGSSYNLYIHDTVTGVTRLVNRNSAGTQQGNNANHPLFYPNFSDDGTKLVYEANSTDLVAGVTDTNNQSDVFLYDTLNFTNTLISVSTTPNVAGNGGSGNDGGGFSKMQITGDGRYVTFISNSTNMSTLAPGNGALQVYRRDLQLNITELISVNAAGTGGAGNNVEGVFASNDGKRIVFTTTATNLTGIPTTGVKQVYLRDLSGPMPTTTLLSRNQAGTAGGNRDSATILGFTQGSRFTADGRFIVFNSQASNLVTGLLDGNGPNANDLYLYDVAAGKVIPAYVGQSGTATGDFGAATGASGHGGTYFIAQTGPTIFYDSVAQNLVHGDRNQFGAFSNPPTDIFSFTYVADASIAGKVFHDRDGDGVQDNVASGPSMALNFDGVNDGVRVPHSAQIDLTAQATVSAWVKLDSLPSQQGAMSIIAKSATGTDFDLKAESSDKFRFIVGNNISVLSTTVIQAGVWYHLAATYKANDRIEIIINGVLDATLLIPGVTRGSNTSDFSIGDNAVKVFDQFDGTIDDVRLYNVVRTPAQIAADMGQALVGNEPGLVLYIPIDESAGVTVFDKTGNGHHGQRGGGFANQKPVRIVSSAPITGPQAVPESGFEFWTVFLDANNNERFDEGETFVVTDDDGNYRFSNLTAGTYSVGFVLGDGFERTLPIGADSTRTVVLANDASSVFGQDFAAHRGPADVGVDLIQKPATAEIGSVVTLSWLIRNYGSSAATGSWQDAVYLSKDQTLDSSDILLSTVSHTGGLAAFSSYTGSATITLPATEMGNYYVLVQTDRRHQVLNENNFENNLLTSSTPIALTITALPLNTPTAGSFTGPGQNRYFSVDVAVGEALSIDLNSVAGSGATELFVSRNNLPTTGDFDYASVANQPDQRIDIAVTQPGRYFVLVRSRFGAAANSSFSVSANVVPFGLQSIEGSVGGNSGTTTIAIHGTRFTPSTVFTLVQGATTISSTNVELNDAATAFVTFDLTGKPLGLYNVRAQQGVTTSTLTSAFTVQSAIAQSLDIRLITPGNLRQGRVSSVVVEFTNRGNNDLAAPLMALIADRAMLRLPGQPFFTGSFGSGASILFLGTASEGPAGVLRPGKTNQVRIEFLTEGGEQGVNVNFQVKYLTNTTVPINWNDFKAELRPANVPLEAWDAIYANFTSDAGNTSGSYAQLLAQNATYLSQLGIRTSDVSRLYEFAIQQASAFLPGQVTLSATDSVLQAPGWDLSLSRVNLQPIADRYRLGTLGYGWAHNWEISLTTDALGDVSIERAGLTQLFSLLPNGTYASASGGASKLTKAGNIFTLVESDGTQLAFLADGKLNYLVDTNTNRITAGYNGQGRLSTLAHSNGVQLQLTYNAAGRLSNLTEIGVGGATGRQVTYAYDAANEHLLSVTDAQGTTSYTYITTGTAQKHALSSVTQVDGRTLSFSYDTRGRLTGQSWNGGSEPLTITYLGLGAVRFADAASFYTAKFNDAGLVEELIDNQGNVQSFDYNSKFQLIRKLTADHATYEYGYDTVGNLIRSTDPLGRSLLFTYDLAHNRMTSQTDEAGYVTKFDYSAQGNLLSVTYPNATQEQFTYDPLGNLTESINRRGSPISYTVNSRGMVTQKSFDDGTTQTFNYDNRDRLTSVVDAHGTTTLQYNSQDQLTRIDFSGGRFLEFSYTNNRRSQSRDQSGFEINYTYDIAGRLFELRDGANALIVRYTYDLSGKLTLKENGNGTSTSHTYNAQGRLITIQNFGPGSVLQSRLDYTYDVMGRKLTSTLTDSDAATTDGTTTYSYDATGQLTGVSLPGGRTIAYEHDSRGNRIRVVDSLLGTTNYTVNEMNQILSAGATSFTYDADGNMISQTDGTGTTTYSWDDENQLIGINAGANQSTFEYDAFFNRVASVVNGVRTNFVYDPDGFGKLVGTYDNGGAAIVKFIHGYGLAAEQIGAAKSFYDFDAQGNVIGLTNGAGVYSNRYSYLPFGETVVHASATSNPFTFAGMYGIERETPQLFRMNARIYSTQTSQFLSEDSAGIYSGDSNWRRYVANSPTNLVDPSGQKAWVGLSSANDAGHNLANIAGVDLAHAHFFFDNGTEIGGFFGKPGPGQSAYDAVTGTVNGQWGAAGLKAKDYNKHKIYEFDDEQALFQAIAEVQKETDRYGYNLFGLGGYNCQTAANMVIARYNDIVGKKPKKAPGPTPGGFSPGGNGSSGSVGALDPNDITGPNGSGAEEFVRPDQTFPYRIRFENVSTATAPAQEVFVDHQLDTDLDFSTFELESFGWGNIVVNIPAGRKTFETTVQTTNLDSSPLLVNVSITFDESTGLVKWTFRSIDPITGEFPQDALAGFLPPNDATQRGEGFVTFKVRPKSGLAAGTVIAQQASIIFDLNNPILTNVYSNTIDGVGPASNVVALPPTTTQTSFNVSWTGSDGAGSGIASYDVYVSTDGGAFVLFQDNVTTTSATFNGALGHTYAFYSVAVDNLGNVEAIPGTPDTTTTVAPPGPSVTISVTGGQLVIIGGVDNEQIRIDAGINGANTARVTSQNGVLINGLTGPVDFAGITAGVVAQMGDGNDTISVFGGNLTGPWNLQGQNGNDTFAIDAAVTMAMSLTGGAGSDTFAGGAGADTMNGENGDDFLFGLGGADLIFGGNGNDGLDGGDQNDTVLGEAGFDYIVGGAGADSLLGGIDNDGFDAGAGDDFIDGGLGNDFMYGFAGNDTLIGQDGADGMDAGAGNDFVDGGAGNDFMYGLDGNDTMLGGDGNDGIDGGIDNDSMLGGNGNDLLFGNFGNDYELGGAGSDSIDGNGGNDTLDGAADNDLIFSSGGGIDQILGGAGDDTLQNIDATATILGGAGNDILYGANFTNDSLVGEDGNDLFFGLSGNDTITTGTGNDTVDGGAGNDAVLDASAQDQLFNVP